LEKKEKKKRRRKGERNLLGGRWSWEVRREGDRKRTHTGGKEKSQNREVTESLRCGRNLPADSLLAGKKMVRGQKLGKNRLKKKFMLPEKKAGNRKEGQTGVKRRTEENSSRPRFIRSVYWGVENGRQRGNSRSTKKKRRNKM